MPKLMQEVLYFIYTAADYRFSPSASPSIRSIDLCFFTCSWPLYVV